MKIEEKIEKFNAYFDQVLQDITNSAIITYGDLKFGTCVSKEIKSQGSRNVLSKYSPYKDLVIYHDEYLNTNDVCLVFYDNNIRTYISYPFRSSSTVSELEEFIFENTILHPYINCDILENYSVMIYVLTKKYIPQLRNNDELLITIDRADHIAKVFNILPYLFEDILC